MSTYAPSPTGRLASNQIWTDSIKRMREQLEMARQSGRPTITETQIKIKVDDLVVWKALTKEGLWRVVEVRGAGFFVNTDFAAIEQRIAAHYKFLEPKTFNPCNEIALSTPQETKLKPEPDTLVIEWVGGPCGVTSNIGILLVVPTKEVRPILNEMEALAIAASE